MKHYPGPWINSPKASDAIIAPNGQTRHEHEVGDYGGALVAESVIPCNKPLIKAGPDLLEACRQAEQVLSNINIYYRSEAEQRHAIEGALSKLRKAIKKAEVLL